MAETARLAPSRTIILSLHPSFMVLYMRFTSHIRTNAVLALWIPFRMLSSFILSRSAPLESMYTTIPPIMFLGISIAQIVSQLHVSLVFLHIVLGIRYTASAGTKHALIYLCITVRCPAHRRHRYPSSERRPRSRRRDCLQPRTPSNTSLG